MRKLYQVFLSSTYNDLTKERDAVTKALQRLNCIVVGMEGFPSSSLPKWDYMKKMIDESDYFLLISGGKYGEIVSEGKSYSQLEYEYALSQNKPILVMLHNAPESLPESKSEKNKIKIQKLTTFRALLSNNQLVKRWSSEKNLVLAIYESVTQVIHDQPASGWVRAEDTSSLEGVLKLRNEKLLLEKELLPLRRSGIADGVLSFYNDISWSNLFKNTKNMDLLFAYAQTWRHNNIIEIERLAACEGNRIRILLPDPNYALAISVIAKRSDCTKNELKKRIQGAANQFKVFQQSPKYKAEIKIKFLEFIPLYGLFSFDTGSVLVLHSHRDGRHGNPTFLLRDGVIRGHLLDEFDRLFRSESGIRDA